MSVLAPIRDYLHALVHPVAQRDGLTAARHRAFMVPRLVGGLAAFAVLPVQLATRGVPSPVEMVVFGWMILATLAVYYVSRTGRLDRAYALGSLGLTAVSTAEAALTGGLGSSLAGFLVLVPLEAALSASRQAVLWACGLVLTAACCLAAVDFLGLLGKPLGSLDPSILPGLAAATAYVAGLALAATAPARLQSELLRSEAARYRLLADNMTEVVLRHARNGAVVFASPAAERVLGLPVEALWGHQLFERVHIADRPAYLKALSDAAIEGTCRTVTFRILHRPGATAVATHPRCIWLEMRCCPFDAAAAGEPAGAERELVATLRDVTERRHRQQVLEQARLQAEQANAAKSRFLTTMSHELRTPLNAIIGFSDLLVDERACRTEGSRRHDYAKLINESGQHLLSVVNGILDMSRLETGHVEISPEPFALGPVMAGCCELLALKAHESGVELVLRHPASMVDIVADKRAIKQVLLNLVANALKFTRRNGHVTVSAMRERSLVAIVVEDTGVGIAEADMARLGDPFFQARGAYDRPHEGTGLGLSIVKRLIDLHGGTFNIESRLGHGTRVTVGLPICPAGSRAARVKTDHSPSLNTVTQIADMRMKKRA